MNGPSTGPSIPLWVVALATIVIVSSASSAYAHHIPGATYEGTYYGYFPQLEAPVEGPVKLQVSGDGESINGFEIEHGSQDIPGRPTDPNPDYTCSFAGNWSGEYVGGVAGEPIIHHRFEVKESDGSFFKGKFTRRQTAVGTVRWVKKPPGGCESDVLTWVARTTASPARSEECRAAKAAVRKAQKALKNASGGSARKKAGKRLKKAKKRREDACG